jgi:Reverse transcriptase (RNA-dependent DNA polymerase)
MRQPEGFDDGTGSVCKLIRPLYGLKQSGNVWNEELTSIMKSLEFTQLKTDYCCFIQQENNSFTIMIVWVDDILSFSSSDAGNDQIEADLRSKFEVSTIRNPSMILGIKLIQKENQISLLQTHFVNSLLNKFELKNANPVTTPLDPNVNLGDNETEENSNTQDNQASHSYATLISSLMYLALRT